MNDNAATTSSTKEPLSVVKTNPTQSAKVTIACIGLDPATTILIKSVVKLHNRSGRHLNLGYNWHFTDGIDADSVLASMGLGIEANLLIVDTDSAAGRTAWYTLKALHPENAMLALSEDPTSMQSKRVLKKPVAAKQLVEILKNFAAEISQSEATE